MMLKCQTFIRFIYILSFSMISAHCSASQCPCTRVTPDPAVVFCRVMAVTQHSRALPNLVKETGTWSPSSHDLLQKRSSISTPLGGTGFQRKKEPETRNRKLFTDTKSRHSLRSPQKDIINYYYFYFETFTYLQFFRVKMNYSQDNS